MHYIWSFLLIARLVQSQIIQANLLHFQSEQAGPFEPLISLGFGSPPQLITGIFDTGSSDIIIPEAGTAVCRIKTQQCRNSTTGLTTGDFDPAKSKDVVRLQTSISASFAGGDEYNGSFIKTDITFGGNRVARQTQVGLVVQGKPAPMFVQFPIFGVGSVDNEASKKPYVNLVSRMKDTGLIKGNIYSVLLNPKPFANGSVTFGGIDKAKFSGNLQEIPLRPNKDGKFAEYIVEMTSMSVSLNGAKGRRARRFSRRQAYGNKKYLTYLRTKRVEGYSAGNDNETQSDGGSSTTIASAAENGRGNLIDLGLRKNERLTLLDTGGVGFTWPPRLVRALAKALDTEFSDRDGLGDVDCQLAEDPKNELTMTFGQAHASVPLRNILLSKDLLDQEDRKAGRCMLVIGADGSSDVKVMGFPWFASTYTVLDLEKKRALIAPGIQDTNQSRLEEFP